MALNLQQSQDKSESAFGTDSEERLTIYVFFYFVLLTFCFYNDVFKA